MLIKQGKINVIGVYAIKTSKGIVKYIGSARECNDAFSRHKTLLINGEYAETNKNELQVLFNTEQEDLIFYVIRECKEDELVKEETKYIKLHRKTIVNKDVRGKRRTSKPTVEETKKRRQVNTGEMNPHCVKLMEDDVIEIKHMLKDRVSKNIIAAKYDISLTHVNSIESGRRWKSVVI